MTMPIEYTLLKDKAPPTGLSCDQCDPFGGRELTPRDLFMRGQVQSTWRRWLRLPYCAVICQGCKTIIGWEKP